MGRKPAGMEVKVPTFFRCPISLEVMRSPVSLCTGVTYDRTSIQRWLDSGNTTCPATMLPLPSTDLVPNLTLRRLIHHWPHHQPSSAAADRHHHLLAGLSSSSTAGDPIPALQRLSDFIADPDADDFDKNALLAASGLGAALASLLPSSASLLAQILAADFTEESNKKRILSSLLADLPSTVSSLAAVLKSPAADIRSRVDAARVLQAILSAEFCDAVSKAMIADEPDVIPELIQLIGPAKEGSKLDRRGVEAGLGCLALLSAVKKGRSKMVKEGVVAAAAAALTERSAVVPAAAAEKGLRVIEAAAGCAEGRAAISDAAEKVVEGVVGRMMKVGREGTESAVIVLWSVCHLFRDRRVQEALAATNGGLTKILLLMQSDCSPAVRQMSGDLLRLFKVNTKSCLVGYDTKTKHIMPF